jgi:hypothetical protein
MKGDIRWIFIVINLLFIAFYMVMIVLQGVFVSVASSCSEEIGVLWDSCQLSVPFCGNQYVHGCDCAVLKVHNYTGAELPESVVQFKSLLRLGVYSGNLSKLPNDLADKMPRLRSLEVWNSKLKSMPTGGLPAPLLWLHLGNNKLSALQEDFGKNVPELSRLNIDNNELTALPASIGDLKSLFTLKARNNYISVLPKEMKSLHNLVWLYLSNNNISNIDPGAFSAMMNLRVLHLQHNRLHTLPDSIFSKSSLPRLSEFFAWNNSLRSIPKFEGKVSLVHVDVRNNRILNFPMQSNDEVTSTLPQASKILLSGNPVCTGITEGDVLSCKEQCSTDCPSVLRKRMHFSKDRSTFFPGIDSNIDICDDGDYLYANTRAFDGNVRPKQSSGCNTELCSFDGGDCSNGVGFIKQIDRM